jgi:metal-responsive CopG/Arc/MetJ family transcriptional regulator
MKQKTSVTLSEDLLRQLDHSARPGESRSSYIERVLRSYFRRQARNEAQARDVERINAAADELDAEMSAVLELQAFWPDTE